MGRNAKWITGGLGFVLGGPIGAIIGFIIGSIIDGASKQEDFYNTQSDRATAEGDFKISLLVLIAVVMKADGRPQKQELDVVKRFLLVNFGEAVALDALQILKGLLQQDINEEEVAMQIKYNMNYSSKLELLHLLFEIAYADGVGHPQELAVLLRISNRLGISSLDFDAIRAPYQKTKDVNWAYKALEIEPSASPEEIKKAYRRMAMKYHPDKVASLGEDIKRTATEKFRNVNEAYEELKKMKNFN